MRLDADLVQSMVLFVVAGAALAVYHVVNPRGDVDRFFMKHNKLCYNCLKACYTILFIAVILNGKHVGKHVITRLWLRMRRLA